MKVVTKKTGKNTSTTTISELSDDELKRLMSFIEKAQKEKQEHKEKIINGI